MCEIAVMMVDFVNQGDKEADALLYKRDDVIEVLEDGADWGDMVVNAPWLRIIKMPGVSVLAMRDLLMPRTVGTGDDLVMLQRRERKLAIDKLAPALSTKILEVKEGARSRVVTLTPQEAIALTAAKETKPVSDDTIKGL